MDKYCRQVKEFQKIFKRIIPDSPMVVSSKEANLRFELVKEEFIEVMDAYLGRDIVELAKELADLQYVVSGMILSFGFANIFPKIFAQVHRSNMSKFDKDHIEYREDGKALKGKNYKKPDLSWVKNENYS